MMDRLAQFVVDWDDWIAGALTVVGVLGIVVLLVLIIVG